MPSKKPEITELVANLIKRLSECSSEQLSEISIAISKHQHIHP